MTFTNIQVSLQSNNRLKYILGSSYILDIKVNNLKIDLAALEDDVSFAVQYKAT